MLKENCTACVLQSKWSRSSLPFLKSKALTFSNTWLVCCQEGESPTINELLHCIQPSKPGLQNQLSWMLWTSSHHLILIMGLHLVQLSIWDNMLKIHCCIFFPFNWLFLPLWVKWMLYRMRTEQCQWNELWGRATGTAHIQEKAGVSSCILLAYFDVFGWESDAWFRPPTLQALAP